MDKIRYISVPLNEDGINEYDCGAENTKNIKVFELQEDEFNMIYESGVFDEINSICNLLIDDYESEEIRDKHLDIALNIASKDGSECIKLIEALNLAIENKTLVGLDF